MAKRKNNRKWIIGGVILAVAIVTGVGVVFALNNGNQEAEKTEEAVKEEPAKEEEKKDEETEEEYSERMTEQKKVKQYEGEDPNKAEELSGAVTYAGVNNGVLIIGMNIDQFLGSGNCALSLVRNGSEIYSANASIVAEVSTSTCDGFNIPVGGLGNGAIEMIIKLSSGEKTGTIRGEVNL